MGVVADGGGGGLGQRQMGPAADGAGVFQVQPSLALTRGARWCLVSAPADPTSAGAVRG
jgi:hypothetical protein